MQIEEKLSNLRKEMKKRGLDAYLITGSDPHGSEYVPPRWRTRQWISGFTGSAGTVVVTLKEAFLWVDSRYYIQGAQEIEGSPFKLKKLGFPGELTPVEWLAAPPQKGFKVGVDHESLTLEEKKELVNRGISLIEIDDLLNNIWLDRPGLPFSKVTPLDDEIAGLSSRAKIDMIRELLSEVGCSDTLIASLDDIAWILNLRGSDIPFNPVFLSFLLIGQNKVVLFTDPRRLEEGLLNNSVEIRNYAEVYDYLQKELNGSAVLYLSPQKSNVRLCSALNKAVKIVEGRDFSSDLKSRKNRREIEGMRRAHIEDALAMVKFLHTVSQATKRYTELSIAEELEKFRAESSDYLGPSFSPIAGFKAHGALAHYSATPESSVELIGDGLLVLDSGGQYETGTTDITRTLLFGEASEQMKRDYTLVLKGNLALTRQVFPEQTAGYQLDAFARQFLWQEGLNYGHGTGHGVGFCLNVHEGPQNISPKPIAVALEEGMVISNEPGIYREGVHGVRLENLVVVQASEKGAMGQFYEFEVLTLVPFEKKLIKRELLSDAEIEQLNGYHERVYRELQEELNEIERAWLRHVTLPL